MQRLGFYITEVPKVSDNLDHPATRRMLNTPEPLEFITELFSFGFAIKCRVCQGQLDTAQYFDT